MPASKTSKSLPDRTDRTDRTDWQRLRDLPDAEIERIAAEDEDNPATSDAHWAEAFDGLPPAKMAVNAKFDADVVSWFKDQGRGYQGRMNAVLRMYMDARTKKPD